MFGVVHISHRFRKNSVLKVLALAGLVTFGSADMLQDAVANGDTRTLTLHHVHSGETATVTFKRNGRYDPAALKQLNVLLQDWRRKEPTSMDPQLFDIIWEVYREVDTTQTIQVIGGYRSPETNAMLRARSRGVAKTSMHMRGKAMDFYIPGVPLSKLREAGLRLQRGGVGFYPTSGSPFVHMDTGGVRHWPRMTRTELARVFPDGKTVHIPADGKPMPGYELALAEVESHGSEPGGAGAAFAGLTPSKGKTKNLFAALFGKDGDDDEESAPDAAVATAKPAAPVAPVAPAPVVAAVAPPAPAPVVVASLDPAAVPLPPPAPMARAAEPAQPADISAASAVALASVPLPSARPSDAPTADAVPASVALASAVPLPVPRPAEAGVLPEIAVPTGSGPVLAYASATTGVFPADHLQPGRAPQPVVVAGVNAPKTGQKVAHGKAAQPVTAAASSWEMENEARRLYMSPTAQVAMRTPELRRFAVFVAPAHQAPTGSFSKDGASTLPTAHFSGATVADAAPASSPVTGLFAQGF